jgi:hypothetical protein
MVYSIWILFPDLCFKIDLDVLGLPSPIDSSKYFWISCWSLISSREKTSASSLNTISS